MTGLWALAAAVLEGFAVLPADTFMPGPSSGHFIEAPDGVATPFPGQPVQGFSDIAMNGDGGYFVLADNGYGSKANSADFVLRIYSVSADFRTADGGSGVVGVNGFVNLSDPYWRLAFPTVSQRETYPGGGDIPVDESIRAQSLLTGADLDLESMAVTPDGSFWIGDEFGPFLLRFGPGGELLEAPYSLPGLVSPDRPGATTGTITLTRSHGFEGLDKTPDGDLLLPMLEGALGDQEGLLNIYSFDVASRQFQQTHAKQPGWQYPLGSGAIAVGAFALHNARQGLVIERDDGQGETAKLKRVYAIDLDRLDENGLLAKQRVLDLMNIDDPLDLNGDGSTRFSYPHWTIEAVLVLDEERILIVNDNNYPFGRARDAERPDGTEFIVVRIGDGGS